MNEHKIDSQQSITAMVAGPDALTAHQADILFPAKRTHAKEIATPAQQSVGNSETVDVPDFNGVAQRWNDYIRLQFAMRHIQGSPDGVQAFVERFQAFIQSWINVAQINFAEKEMKWRMSGLAVSELADQQVILPAGHTGPRLCPDGLQRAAGGAGFIQVIEPYIGEAQSRTREQVTKSPASSLRNLKRAHDGWRSRERFSLAVTKRPKQQVGLSETANEPEFNGVAPATGFCRSTPAVERNFIRLQFDMRDILGYLDKRWNDNLIRLHFVMRDILGYLDKVQVFVKRFQAFIQAVEGWISVAQTNCTEEESQWRNFGLAVTEKFKQQVGLLETVDAFVERIHAFIRGGSGSRNVSGSESGSRGGFDSDDKVKREPRYPGHRAVCRRGAKPNKIKGSKCPGSSLRNLKRAHDAGFKGGYYNRWTTHRAGPPHARGRKARLPLRYFGPAVTKKSKQHVGLSKRSTIRSSEVTPENHPDFIALEFAIREITIASHRINEMKSRVYLIGKATSSQKRKESDVRHGLSEAFGRRTKRFKKQNYDAKRVAEAKAKLDKSGTRPRLIVDCSHGNSKKDHRNWPLVVAALYAQIANAKGHHESDD
ncbi:MAG: hypothetical protein M1826_006256 [Phylliscum demangeonii]|nr:MAG: hypothetical protein M1826_006256 [Phylliscum demangeonii]